MFPAKNHEFCMLALCPTACVSSSVKALVMKKYNDNNIKDMTQKPNNEQLKTVKYEDELVGI